MKARAVSYVLSAGFISAALIFANAQDAPIPKPKTKANPAPQSQAPKAVTSERGPTLRVVCDIACNWNLDGGVAKGDLMAGSSTSVKIGFGQHIVIATAANHQDQIKQRVDITESGQTLLNIELKQVQDSRLQHEEVAQKQAQFAWTDPDTGLMWTKADNQTGIDWVEANNYCKELRSGGYTDWRLATIEELQSIFDPYTTSRAASLGIDWHVKGNLNLSGLIWSSSTAAKSSDRLAFSFMSGRESWDSHSHSPLRALCLRSAAK